MKLYEVPRNTKIRVVGPIETTPPGALPIISGDVLKLINLDGMYSYCKNSEGHVVHLYAGQEVELVDEEK